MASGLKPVIVVPAPESDTTKEVVGARTFVELDEMVRSHLREFVRVGFALLEFGSANYGGMVDFLAGPHTAGPSAKAARITPTGSFVGRNRHRD